MMKIHSWVGTALELMMLLMQIQLAGCCLNETTWVQVLELYSRSVCECACKNEQLQRDIFLQFGNVLSVMHLKLKRQRNVSLNKPFTQFLHLSRQLQACYLSIIRETHEKMLSIQFFFFFYVSFLPFPCIHTFLHFLMTMHFQTFFSQFTYDCIAQSHTTLRYARFYFIQFVKTKKSKNCGEILDGI